MRASGQKQFGVIAALALAWGLMVAVGALASTSAQAQSSGEVLDLPVPQGWQAVVNTRQGNMQETDYVPPGQSDQQWRDRLIVQVFHGLTDVTAAQFYERLRQGFEQSCDRTTAGDLQGAMSNGFLSAFWVLGCHRNRATGVGETTFFRLIQGYDALYMVQRSWRTPAYGLEGPPVSMEERRAAIELLQQVRLCISGSSQHPCN